MGTKLNWLWMRSNQMFLVLVLPLFLYLINQFITPINAELSNSFEKAVDNQEIVFFNYQQGDSHHIVKRKSRIKLGSWGKNKNKNKNKNNSPQSPYPKQPGHPGSSNPYPQQPAHNPSYMGGGSPSNMGPPPPYPGLNNQKLGGSGNVPNYQQPGFNYGYGNRPAGGYGAGYPNQGSFGSGYPNQGFGGGYGGFGKAKSSGIGKIGSAGFGAAAGGLLGAYGGYQLGKMVGGLGRSGHYGYYSDHGQYIRCDPPRNIKVDPVTNITYIPLEEDYDKRCSYFDRQPPRYYNPSALNSANFIQNPINRLLSDVFSGGSFRFSTTSLQSSTLIWSIIVLAWHVCTATIFVQKFLTSSTS